MSNLDARHEARKVLSKIWGGRPYPVDPVTIGELLGLSVLETELPENVSGALIKEAGKEPVIVLHKFDHKNRKRFSCAHELGHYISRAETNNSDLTYEYVDLRNDLSTLGADPEEIFANKFAANLLMPDEDVKKIFSRTGSHFETALYFGVSVEALKNKLNALGLLR